MRRTGFVVTMLLSLLALTAPAEAQSTEQIADELALTGRYLEQEGGPDLDAAIDGANAEGIAFVWLDSGDDATALAAEISDSVEAVTSDYPTVLVLTDSGVGAFSQTRTSGAVQAAVDAGFDSFANRAEADGVARFAAALVSGAGATASTSPAGSAGADGDTADSGSSGGFGFGSIILAALGGLAGLFGLRAFLARRRAAKQRAADLETDRAEIKEQLRNNADRVIDLGDQVIASGRAELQTTYEEASSTYQDVSQSVDGASTAEEIDRLDDRIDTAEWQFESIEAQLAGRPVPPSPAQRQAEAAAAARAGTAPAVPPNDDGPALSGPGPAVPGPAGGYPAPRPRGGFGGLGGILGGIIFGGALGGPSSRRSRRRSGHGHHHGGGFGGGLGGGVLTRGPSRPRSTTRRRSRPRSTRRGGSGGRSFSRRRGGGGGRRF